MLLLGALMIFAISACTPEGVINKTKYNGEKITNTCDAFKEEIQAITNANSSTKLVVAEYDNSDFDYYYLEPGQFEIKDGFLNFRLIGDLEFEKYLTKGIGITIAGTYESVEMLRSLENPQSGNIGSLLITREYYDANKEPVFMYKMPIEGNAKDLDGKKIKLTFTVAKYKKGKVKKVFCKSDEVPLGPITPACCDAYPWDQADPQSVIPMPEVKIDDENYKYRGFTGTLDLIFPENSVKFDQNLLTTAIQDYIMRYSQAGYQVTSIDLEGWASLGGVEERNQQLSERRATAVHDDLKKSMGGFG